MKSRDILIWLNNLKGVNNRYLEFLDKSYPNLVELWEMSDEQVHSIKGIGEKFKRSIVENRSRSYYSGISELIDENQVEVLTSRDENYP